MSKKIEQFEDLPLWKNASAIAVGIYKLSEIGKLKNDFGMKDQIRRSAASISNNIAEGSGANTNKDFSDFLDISIKPVLETVNILYFALLRKYISETKQKELYKEAETLIRKTRAFKKTLR